MLLKTTFQPIIILSFVTDVTFEVDFDPKNNPEARPCMVKF